MKNLKLTDAVTDQLEARLNMGHGARISDLCMHAANHLSEIENEKKAGEAYAVFLNHDRDHLEKHGKMMIHEPKVRKEGEKAKAEKYLKFQEYRKAAIKERDNLRTAWNVEIQKWLIEKYGEPTRDKMGVIVSYGAQPGGLILTSRYKLMKMSACNESPYHAFNGGT